MVAITGAGILAFGRREDATIEGLGAQAARLALADADVTPRQIDACYFANALGSQLFGDTTIGQAVCARIGVRAVPVYNVENACTSGSTAFHLAWQAVLAGQCQRALVVGAEKMFGAPLGLIGSGRSDADSLLGMVAPAMFALRAQRHMHEFGTTAAQLAGVTVKSRRHARLNPYAQLRQEESIEQVLAAPMIADPLTRSQCCPIADGAAALVLSGDRAAAGRSRAVHVRHSVLVSGSYLNPFDLVRWETDYRAARLAYEGAGVGPADLDVVECHDAFSIAEILHCEALGLCAPGEGGSLTASGATALGGRIPVNVSGGLLSRGHPIAATGVAQLVEIAMQLRGERGALQIKDCRLGLAQCMGGDRAGDTKSCSIVVLSR